MFTSSFYSRGRHRAALVLCGSLLALALPALFLAAPAQAQSNADQTAITQLLRSVINLQTQVMQSGNRDLLDQSQALLQQVRELMTAIETGGPLPTPGSTADDTSDTAASEATPDTSDTVNNTTLGVRENGVTVCPDLTVTERELRDYIEGAYSLERPSQIRSYNPNIPPGVACLGEAIVRQCDTAISHHEAGYTFYVTSGESAYDDPVFGTQRCYIGLSETDRPEEAAMCNLYSIANADRGRDERITSFQSGLVSTIDFNWFLKVTLPEFIADHVLPLGGQQTYFGGGGDRENRTPYYFGTDPIARLASQMECTQRGIDLPDQAE